MAVRAVTNHRPRFVVYHCGLICRACILQWGRFLGGFLLVVVFWGTTSVYSGPWVFFFVRADDGGLVKEGGKLVLLFPHSWEGVFPFLYFPVRAGGALVGQACP